MIRHWVCDQLEMLILFLRRKDFPEKMVIAYFPASKIRIRTKEETHGT